MGRPRKNNKDYTEIVNLSKKGVTRDQLDFVEKVISDDFFSEDENRFARYNDFPQFFAKTISQSPTATACIRVLKDFTAGGGFTEDIEEMIVNEEGETFEEINKKISNDLGYLERFAILVLYNLDKKTIDTKISEIYVLPIEHCRFGLPSESGHINTIVYNPYVGTSEQSLRKQYRIYPIFNPKKVLIDLENFRIKDKKYAFGQVFFYSKSNEYNRIYSRPDFVSAIDCFMTEKELWQFHLRNCQNNFLIGGMINLHGDPTQIITDPATGKEKTRAEFFNEKAREMFAGTGNAGAFMVNWFRKVEESAKIEPFQTNNNDTKFLELSQITRDQIITTIGVPPILAGISVAGKLSDTKEKKEAIMLMNNRVGGNVKTKDSILNKIMKIFSGKNADGSEYVYKKFQTKPISKYEEIPIDILNLLPLEEKDYLIRKEYNLPSPEQPIV